ncbi:MAG: c-type cytochrome [Acidobacteriota bacterium]|nr:MAG: c-type cytochrome [Acidobacteriota bacterium]
MRKLLSLATVIMACAAMLAATLNGAGAAQSNNKSGIARTYGTHCSKCHGDDGKGIESLQPPDFTSAEWQKSRTDKQLADVIRGGVGIMPGYKSTLKAAEISQMVKYVRSFGPKAAKK